MEWSPEVQNICLEFYRAHSIKMLKSFFLLVYQSFMKKYFKTMKLVKLHQQICETYHSATFFPIRHGYEVWLQCFKKV